MFAVVLCEVNCLKIENAKELFQFLLFACIRKHHPECDVRADKSWESVGAFCLFSHFENFNT